MSSRAARGDRVRAAGGGVRVAQPLARSAPEISNHDTRLLGAMRRLIRDISSVLILSGLLLVLDAGVTLVWQEPVTAAIATVLRSNIDQHFLSYRTAPLSRLDASALGSLRSTQRRGALPAPRGGGPGRTRGGGGGAGEPRRES